MVTCAGFTNNLECVLTYQNDFNIKLMLLTFLMLFIFLSIWYSREMSYGDDVMDIYKWFSFNAFPKVLLVFSPFFWLMLSHNVNVELVINTMAVIYFLVLALFIGLALFYAKNKIKNIMGDKRDFATKMKYRKYSD
jgi:hypothetical protein